MSAGTIIDTRETGATPTALETCDDTQARDFVARWIAERAIASFEIEATPEQVALVRRCGNLTSVENDRLLAWVREWLGKRAYGRTVLRKTQALAALLDCADDVADALRRDARWPS